MEGKEGSNAASERKASSEGATMTAVPSLTVDAAGAPVTAAVAAQPPPKKPWWSFGKKGEDAKEKPKEEKEKDEAAKDKERFEQLEKELEGMDEKVKEVVLAQVSSTPPKKISFFALFRFTTPFEHFLNAVGIIAAIAAGAAQPGMALVMGRLSTEFVSFGSALNGQGDLESAKVAVRNAVNQDILNLVYLGFAVFVGTYLYASTFIWTGELATRRIRERFFKSLLRQNIAFFDYIGGGSVATTLTTSTHLIQEGISDKFSIAFHHLGAFVAGFAIAFYQSWRLALVIMTTIPAMSVVGGLMGKFVVKIKTEQEANGAKSGSLVEDVLSSIRTAHAFGTQARLAAKFDQFSEDTMKLGFKSAVVTGLGMGGFFFINFSGYALSFYYGTTLILQGRGTAGEVIAVFMSIMIGSYSLAQLAPSVSAVSSAIAAAQRIFNIIDREPAIDSSSPAGEKREKVQGEISLKAVNFVYPSRPSVQVLFDFSATFPIGKSTAIVGPSGSGKSTIVSLLLRFYDPIAGTIQLDGIPLPDWNLKSLRSHIGYVGQEPVLFSTTAYKNIEYGLCGTRYEHLDPDEKRKRVEEAARVAYADTFIQLLPQGYDTAIGDRGMLLSGGQKQRIAIARAIVADPPILCLDEATSALDTKSESIVQAALDRASAGRTTISIAHRLSTIRRCDQILVLAGGRLIEGAASDDTGSAHDHLLQRDGQYKTLVNAQRFRELAAEEVTQTPAAVEQEDILPPQMSKLSKTVTGRSAGSKAASVLRHDLEKGGPPPPSPFALFKRMAALVKDLKLLYLFGALGAACTGMIFPVFGIVFGLFFGVLSLTDPQELRREANLHALYCFFIALVAGLATAVQMWTYIRAAEILCRRLRTLTFKSMLRQDVQWHDADEHSSGSMAASVNLWPSKINGLAGVTLGTIVQTAFSLFGGTIVGFAYSWRITLVGVACWPLVLTAGAIRMHVVVLKDERIKKTHSNAAQLATETTNAIRTIAALTRENHCFQAYQDTLDAPQRDSSRTALISNLFFALSQGMGLWVVALCFWFGVGQLIDGKVSVSAFFICLMAVTFGSMQAGQIFGYVPDASSSLSAAREIVKIADSEPTIDTDSDGGAPSMKTCEGAIAMEGVHFRYSTRPDIAVLRGIDINVAPGQYAAIVGPSGSGKSTIIQLLERYYDPLAGTVKVDGVDISTLDVQSYRSHCAVVSQEPTLYSGTVRYNVALGSLKPEADISQAEVEKACREANIHDFIISLPEGYDTELGEKGTQLSGGQRQRIAIARALIREPKILLLDEASAALDSTSEKVVQEALDKAAKSRSCIAVAHRLTTIQHADVIFVLNDGRVVEKGTHDQLMRLKGLYAELVEQQNLSGMAG